MLKNLLRYISYISPFRIYIGKSISITDSDRASDIKYQKKLDDSTAKVMMKRYYSVYQVEHILTDPKSKKNTYSLVHCFTGQKLQVSKEVFDTIFDRI